MRKGDIVEVEFWDHADGPVPVKFKVWGRLRSVSKLAYTIYVWTYASPKEQELYDDDNVEQRTIVRTAVTKIKKLYKRKERE